MKVLGNTIKIYTKEVKCFSVDKILKYHMIKKYEETKITIHEVYYGIRVGRTVEYTKCRTTLKEVQNQISTFYLHKRMKNHVQKLVMVSTEF